MMSQVEAIVNSYAKHFERSGFFSRKEDVYRFASLRALLAMAAEDMASETSLQLAKKLRRL
jgi:hypothetical protein